MQSIDALARVAARLDKLISEIRAGSDITAQQLSEIGEILSTLRVDGAPQSAQHIHDIAAAMRLLQGLTLGAPPEGLRAEVVAVWSANTSRWLTRSADDEIRSQISEATRDVRKIDEDIVRLEGDIRLREQRLETLTALADLLDALAGQIPPNQEKAS